MEITKLNYGIAVAADDAEIEIIILMSPGQSGHTSLYMICMACDGGLGDMDDIVIQLKYGELLADRNFTHREIVRGLRKIRSTFVDDSDFLTKKDIREILHTLIDMYDS